MSTYKIVRIDSRMDDCAWNSLWARPMIYFKPDTDFVEFSKRNNGFVRVTISNTGSSAYDNQTFWGFVEKSATMPDGRMNFYDVTGLWVIVLHTLWNGYPPKLGQFKLNKGVVDPDPQLEMQLRKMGQKPVYAPKKQSKVAKLLSQSGSNTSQQKGLSTYDIIAIFVSLIILLVFVFVLKKLYKN